MKKLTCRDPGMSFPKRALKNRVLFIGFWKIKYSDSCRKKWIDAKMFLEIRMVINNNSPSPGSLLHMICWDLAWLCATPRFGGPIRYRKCSFHYTDASGMPLKKSNVCQFILGAYNYINHIRLSKIGLFPKFSFLMYQSDFQWFAYSEQWDVSRCFLAASVINVTWINTLSTFEKDKISQSMSHCFNKLPFLYPSEIGDFTVQHCSHAHSMFRADVTVVSYPVSRPTHLT